MTHSSILLAVFNSAHRVMKAEAILKKSCIDMLLIPAPRALSTDCGLAIRFSDSCLDTVLQSLERENILPDSVYRKISDSRYEPIWNNSIETSPPLAVSKTE